MGRPKKIHAEEQDIGADRTAEFKDTENGPELAESVIEVPNEKIKGLVDKKTEMLRFMEEPVEVVVHEASDENAYHIVDIYVNGQPEFFERGVPKVTKRKYVEVLARAKEIKYRPRNPADPFDDGHVGRYTLRYPFSVNQDTEKGRQWLKKVLREA